MNRMTMKTVMLVIALASPLSLAACGSQVYKPELEPSKPFGGFGRAEIRELKVRVANLDTLPPEVQTEIRSAARNFPDRLAARLKKKQLLSGDSGKTLIIAGELVEYDPGSQTARWMIGFGAGSGMVTAVIHFAEDDGTDIARGNALGTVAGGFLGGAIDSAVDRMVEAIVKYIEKNCREQKTP